MGGEMKEILSEMELHANLMGMIFPKDNETLAVCLRAVLDSRDAMQAALDAVLNEAVWAMELILVSELGWDNFVKAQAFLASPDVQAWRARQNGKKAEGYSRAEFERDQCGQTGTDLGTRQKEQG